jgi:FkbM family methyltransferase
MRISVAENQRFQQWYMAQSAKQIEYLFTLLEDDLSKHVLQKAIESRVKNEMKFTEDAYNLCMSEEKSMQYFPEIIKLSDNEVFIDGGGYLGETTLDFIKKVNNKFKKIYVFEPIEDSYCILLDNFNKRNISSKKVITVNAGLSSSTEQRRFCKDGYSSKLDSNGDTLVDCIKFDDYLSESERNDISYIKLDIEGMELNALEGMKSTIQQFKPKLAIAIYHFTNHLWKVPLFVHQLNPTYKLYIRQHDTFFETVLYAINDK